MCVCNGVSPGARIKVPRCTHTHTHQGHKVHPHPLHVQPGVFHWGGGLPGCTVVHLDAGSFRVHKSAAREDAVSKWNPVVLDSCGTRSVRSSFQDTIMSITLYHNMTQSHCPTFWSRYLNMTLSHCLHYGLDLLT